MPFAHYGAVLNGLVQAMEDMARAQAQAARHAAQYDAQRAAAESEPFDIEGECVEITPPLQLTNDTPVAQLDGAPVS